MNAPMNGRITEMAADPGNDIFAVVSIKKCFVDTLSHTLSNR